MSMVQLGDFIFAILAEYMLANLMCKIIRKNERGIWSKKRRFL